MRFLGLPSLTPQDPPDTLTLAGDDVSERRVYSGLGNDAKPKNPAYGDYFHNLLTNRLERWNSEQWETIAGHVIGMAPFSGTAEREANALAPFKALGGPSGSSVAPAPGNTQTPTTPAAGGVAQATFSDTISTRAFDVTPLPIPAGTDVDIPFGGLTAGFQGGGRAVFMVGFKFVTAIGVGDCRITLTWGANVINTELNNIVSYFLMTDDYLVAPGFIGAVNLNIEDIGGAGFSIESLSFFATTLETVYV